MLIFYLVLFFLQKAVSQEDGNIVKFRNSFAINFYPDYLLDNDSSVFTQSLLVVNITKRHKCDSIYFTDGAPIWQKAELKQVMADINTSSLDRFAKQKKYTGKLVFPVVIKSELIKNTFDEMDVYGRFKSVFSQNGEMLKGSVIFFSPIVITAGVVIRCFSIAPPIDPFKNLKPIRPQ